MHRVIIDLAQNNAACHYMHLLSRCGCVSVFLLFFVIFSSCVGLQWLPVMENLHFFHLWIFCDPFGEHTEDSLDCFKPRTRCCSMCWPILNDGLHLVQLGYTCPVTSDVSGRVVRVTSVSLLVSQGWRLTWEQSLDRVRECFLFWVMSKSLFGAVVL